MTERRFAVLTRMPRVRIAARGYSGASDLKPTTNLIVRELVLAPSGEDIWTGKMVGGREVLSVRDVETGEFVPRPKPPE